jgi:hypothetical protein
MAQLDVENDVLVRMGNVPVSAGDTGVPYQTVHRFYDATVKEVHKVFPWSSAIVRVEMTPVTPDIETEWTYAFTLPDDFSRALDVNGNPNIKYRIEGTTLYTDDDTGILRYVAVLMTADTTPLIDDGAWEPLLRECIVSRLAAKSAMRVTGSADLVQLFYQEYIINLSAARDAKAQEEKENLFDFTELYKNMAIAMKKNFVQE